MFKMFLATAIVTAFAVQSAPAGDCSTSAAKAPAAESAKHDTQPTTGTQQAERSPSTRSFSIQPSTSQSDYRSTNRSFYTDNIRSEPRIIGSYGQRPASDKMIGNY